MELMADVSTLTSNINNALQVTEDIFYARIYTRYLYLLRASVWKDNIENKMLVIQRSYNLLNEEVSMYLTFNNLPCCALTAYLLTGAFFCSCFIL